MKLLISILFLYFFVASIFAQSYYERYNAIEPCNFRLDNIESLKLDKNKYTRAVLSPDSKKILLIGSNKSKVMDIKTRKIIREFDYDYKGQWINDSLILFKNNKLAQVYWSPEKKVLPIPKMKFVNNHKLIAERNNQQWVVADFEDNNNLYCFISHFSNDFRNVVIFTNSGKEYVYNVDGSGLLMVLEFGISCDWSDDNKKIISQIEVDDGHNILESDICIYEIETKKVCRLTNTKEIFETRPSWSGNKITYIDDKTNQIYIADIIEKRGK